MEDTGRSIALMTMLAIFTLNLYINLKLTIRRIYLYCKSRCAKKRPKKEIKKEVYEIKPTDVEKNEMRIKRSDLDKKPHRAVSEQSIPPMKVISPSLQMMNRFKSSRTMIAA